MGRSSSLHSLPCLPPVMTEFLAASSWDGSRSIQMDSITSSSDSSLYIETSIHQTFIPGDTNVSSSSDISSSSSCSSRSSSSSSLESQLKESPWVTSTTTEDDQSVFQPPGYSDSKLV